MNKIEVKIINRSMHDLPEYKTQGAAGLDIAAFLSEVISLAPMERKLIPTGIFLEIPLGFEVQIRPRSGLSIKQGLTVINAPGTIDSDYRGEVMVPLVNLSQEVQEVKNGDRIAQMILAKHEIIVWNEVQDLSETDRGVGGFGHTGK